jgi:hypothetical protein
MIVGVQHLSYSRTAQTLRFVDIVQPFGTTPLEASEQKECE